jgi:hypothetical protein
MKMSMFKKSIHKIWGVLILIFLISCSHEPRPPHVYEQNPEFTYMRVEFFGQFYAHIPYYVFSFTFLTDGMWNEDSTAIIAPGQFLFIENVFVPKEQLDFLRFDYAQRPDMIQDFVLTEKDLLEMLTGEYRASGRVGAENFGDSFTFAPGEIFRVDNRTYTIGARIMYYEENPFFSARKLITGGSFTVSPDGIVFNLVTDGRFVINGIYRSPPEASERKIHVRYATERELEKF